MTATTPPANEAVPEVSPKGAPASRIALNLGTIYVLWSTTFLAIRETLDGLQPFTLCLFRYTAAACLLFGVALATRAPKPSRREIAGSAVLGVLIVLIPNGAVAWAEQTIATGVTALLGACTPLFVLIIESARARGERPTLQGVAGIFLGLAGVTVLVGPQLRHGFDGALVAQLAQLGGSFVGACGMVGGKSLPTPRSALYNSAFTMLLGGLYFIPLAAFHGEFAAFHPSAVPSHAWLGLAYLVVFGSCLGFSAFSWLVQNARPSLVATMSYVNPVLAMFVGLFVLSEPLPPTLVAAAVMIVASVVLVASSRRRIGARQP
jgi:drug/metabolite transporter (DMT)-like permease